MKKILLLLTVMVLCSCNFKGDIEYRYKYKVIGKVVTKDGLKDSIWYSDTLSLSNDTLFYTNSDGSVVKIAPPYEVEEIN